MTFIRSTKLERIGKMYGGGLLPKIVVSRGVVPFDGFDTIVTYVVLTPFGLKRYNLL